MRRQTVVALLAVLAAVVPLGSGCAHTATTTLRYDPVVVDKHGRSDARLAVLPLSEGRGPLYYPGLQGRLFLTYIPLLPYVHVPYERLDESYIRHRRNLGATPAPDEHFTIAMARQIAWDLEQAGLFREVVFVSDPSTA